jgi:glycolate oxidase FAD binding subunit
MTDVVQQMVEKVRHAAATGTPLSILGGGSRGMRPSGQSLRVSAYRGIVDYDPRELYLTARAGTPLEEIEAILATEGQMLAFEPPRFSPDSTLGGAFASGASGPRRPYAGAARDFVLGCRMVDGRGEVLRFGGQVMKNVAGYDVARLMAGAWGTLGVVLDISLKVLPRPQTSLTLVHESPLDLALPRMREISAKPLPLDAVCHLDGRLHLRFSGSEDAVQAARRRLGGEVLQDADRFWQRLRDRQLPFFDGEMPLWRLAVPTTATLGLQGAWLVEWGGAQRWLRTSAAAATVCAAAQAAGGHATLFQGVCPLSFPSLGGALLALHGRLKAVFDPHGLFNPGVLF